MVSDVDSQCELLPTFGSELVNVTSHETLPLTLTRYVVLLVLKDAGEAASVSVVEYSWPATAVPPPTPQVLPV